MTYELQVERAAQRALEALPPNTYLQIERVIDDLAFNPRPRNSKKLRGTPGLWRLRVGQYRVIYVIFDTERLVKIILVRRRSEDTYDL